MKSFVAQWTIKAPDEEISILPTQSKDARQCRGRMRVFSGTCSESTGRGELTETIWCSLVVYPESLAIHSGKYFMQSFPRLCYPTPVILKKLLQNSKHCIAFVPWLPRMPVASPPLCRHWEPGRAGTDLCPVLPGWVWWAAFVHATAKEKVLSTALHLRPWPLFTGPKWELKSYPRYWCWISEMLF